MKQISKLSIQLLAVYLVLGFLFAPVAAFAKTDGVDNQPQDGVDNEERTDLLENPAEGQLVDIDNFGDLLKRIVEILLQFAGVIAVIFLVIGGYQYIVARGNEEAMEKAKKTITGAIVGIVVIVLAFAIVQIVNNLLTS